MWLYCLSDEVELKQRRHIAVPIRKSFWNLSWTSGSNLPAFCSPVRSEISYLKYIIIQVTEVLGKKSGSFLLKNVRRDSCKELS